MTGVWIFGAVTAGVLLTVLFGVWCWPSCIPKGRSVDEIRQRIEDEENDEL
ncbi:hypothetical protein [Nocardia sp. NRRL WC-3656]|uniref:hypothetical protein n=1 Tax=Nocardia sp. NRRL WC-3656 TaxID=1463824 RepID=UPI000AA769C4|nr:hypothetical protein [Nocardia sp. NRRL WC-3656]